MNRRVRRLSLVGAAATALVMAIAPSGSASVAEPLLWTSTPTYQVASTGATLALGASGGGVAQRFVASASGIVGHIHIQTANVADASSLLVSISDDVSTWPTPNTLLGSEPVSAFDGVTGAGSADFTADNIPITSGTEYLVTVENFGSDIAQVQMAQGGYPDYGSFVPGPGATWADSGNPSNLVATIDADVYDSDAPDVAATVTPTKPNGAHGWYRTRPQVTFNCVDATSGVATCPGSLLVPNGNHRRSPIQVQATDVAGHTTTYNLRLKVDTIKPRLRITGVKAGKVYARPPSVGCHALDTLSGLDHGCAIRVVQVSQHRRLVRAQATDLAGNVSTRRIRYFVK
jgi:hypothetical protein